MRKTIYYSLLAGLMLIPQGFGVVFVNAQTSSSESVVTNKISVKVNTGNIGSDGQNGSDGLDGTDGADGADGGNAGTTGDSKASVSVTTIVDGTEVPSATIDIETSEKASVVIEKNQTIVSDDGVIQVQNNVSVNEASEADATDLDSVSPQLNEPAKTGFVGMVSGVLITVAINIASFITGLFELF